MALFAGMRGFFVVLDGDVHTECVGLSCEVLAHRAVVVSSVAFESHGYYVVFCFVWCYKVDACYGVRL